MRSVVPGKYVTCGVLQDAVELYEMVRGDARLFQVVPGGLGWSGVVCL